MDQTRERGLGQRAEGAGCSRLRGRALLLRAGPRAGRDGGGARRPGPGRPLAGGAPRDDRAQGARVRGLPSPWRTGRGRRGGALAGLPLAGARAPPGRASTRSRHSTCRSRPLSSSVPRQTPMQPRACCVRGREGGQLRSEGHRRADQARARGPRAARPGGAGGSATGCLDHAQGSACSVPCAYAGRVSGTITPRPWIRPPTKSSIASLIWSSPYRLARSLTLPWAASSISSTSST